MCRATATWLASTRRIARSVSPISTSRPGSPAMPPIGSPSRVIATRTTQPSARSSASHGRVRSTRGLAARSAPSETATSSQSACRWSAAARSTASTRPRGPSAVRTRAREIRSSARTACSSRSADRT
ncbi:Uncharacterised protein [Mycobacteroides abscessus subsp. abscessus]|nr:Uncharacterised protein [Mycobacteroides abscessus subsp. abscessus]